MSFKTVHGNTMYGNPVYHEASDIGGKDVLGNEQVAIIESPPTILEKFCFAHRLWIIPYMEYTANQLMTIFRLLLIITPIVTVALVWTLPAMMY